MKRSIPLRVLLAEGTALAYILLFTYASASKLADFENFQVQLAQSPMTSSFAQPLSYMVPFAELAIAAFLIGRRWRFTALFLSFTLMVLFTAYIYIILNYSAYVPCSCGGVLEDLSWNEHLLFNLAFILLASLSIALYPIEKIDNP